MAKDSPSPDPAAPSPPQAAEAELLAQANVWAEAIVSNDVGRIAAFVTTDWVIVSDTGISPGEKFLALVASGDLTHSAMDIVGRARIRVMGETAILTSRIRSTTNYRGHQSHADEWTTDVFVKRDGRWLCALTHYTAAKP